MINAESITRAGTTKSPTSPCPAGSWQSNKLFQTNRWWNSSQHQRGQYKNNEQNQPGELRSFCSFPHTTAYTHGRPSPPYCWRCTDHITCKCRSLNASSSEPTYWARIHGIYHLSSVSDRRRAAHARTTSRYLRPYVRICGRRVGQAHSRQRSKHSSESVVSSWAYNWWKLWLWSSTCIEDGSCTYPSFRCWCFPWGRGFRIFECTNDHLAGIAPVSTEIQAPLFYWLQSLLLFLAEVRAVKYELN